MPPRRSTMSLSSSFFNDMVDKLKKGHFLTIKAINPGGYPISVSVPLTDFAKAYDAPAADPSLVEAQQKKLEEELQRRAEEQRKKMEGQQTQAGPPAQADAGARLRRELDLLPFARLQRQGTEGVSE